MLDNIQEDIMDGENSKYVGRDQNVINVAMLEALASLIKSLMYFEAKIENKDDKLALKILLKQATDSVNESLDEINKTSKIVYQ